jgi:putative GTP pyrophosphokinase
MFESSSKPIVIPERQKLHILYTRYRIQYENILRKIARRLNKLLIRSKTNYTIKYRLKSFDSFFNKLTQQRDGNSQPAFITDFMGIRIICPFLEDLEHIEKVITDNFKLLEVEHKGQKNSVREFGYNSIHLLVDIEDELENGFIPHVSRVCEIQLRTILQDAWAEVEHELIYKANFSLFNESIKRKLASLNASLTLSDIIFQEIRDYQKEIESRRQKCRNSVEEKLQISIIGDAQQLAINTEAISKTMPLKPQSDLEKLLFKALEEHSDNHFEQAVDIYSSILRMKPKPHVRSIVYNHRGMAYFALGEYTKSIKDFNRALEFNPKNTRILNNRGLVYRMIDQTDNALKDLEFSLQINEYQHESWHLRALVYSDLNDIAHALENCERALKIKSDYTPSQNLKGLLLSKL